MKTYKNYIIPIALFVFYTVGVIGILMPSMRSQVLRLTPMNLLLTAFLLLWGNGKNSVSLIKAVFFAFSLGFIVEVLGVQTGVLFGAYSYGDPLGFKVFDVPLLIGVNWLILSFSSLGIAGKIVNSSMFQVILSSLLMVFLDFIIEPVAIQLDFWNWTHGEIPIQNYIMWLATSLVVNSIAKAYLKEVHFKTSLYVMLAQIYFFTSLQLFL